MKRRSLSAALLAAPFAAAEAAPQAPAAQPAAAKPLFAIEFRTGPKWDAARKPHEQDGFAGHSANLKRLRDAGALLLGARYSDKGLVVLTADSEASARAEIDGDPSVAAGTFVYELHALRVFYPGCVG